MDSSNEKIIQAVLNFLEAVQGSKDNKAVSDLVRGMIDKLVFESQGAAVEQDQKAAAIWSNIDHDLRSPMCGILGFTEILLEEISDPDLKWKAGQIKISAQRIMDILSNSKIYRYEIPQETETPKSAPAQVASLPAIFKTEEPARKKARSAGRKLPNVLIVEDNMVNSNLLMQHLKKHCHLFFSQTGKAAIDLALNEKIEAIFMDINLGEGMDGVQAMVEIRKQTGNENLPIIAITGYAGKSDKEKFLLAGFTDFVAKPFEKRDVVCIIENLFRQED